MQRFLSAFLLLLIAFAGIGVSHAQGLLFDKEQFASRQKMATFRGALPLRSSMKMYTPMSYPQVGSTCVGQTFSNARTMLLAKSLKWTDQQKITGLSFSPYFIYYRNKDANDVNCEQGLNIELAARDVLQHGFAPLSTVEYPDYYPFTQQALCLQNGGTQYPPSMTEDQGSAQRFMISDIYRVPTVKDLKTALSKGMPVVLCMMVAPSFSKVKGDVWTVMPADKIEGQMGHAVLAVGYDDTKYGGSFEIMNSWGDTWGNKGFTHVRYKDWDKWFYGGYAFYAADNAALNKEITAAFSATPAAPGQKKAGSLLSVSRDHGKVTVPWNNSRYLKAFNPAETAEGAN